MNWKRIGRALVCLLVVCCLLVNISPIRAEATGLEAVAAPVVASVPGLNVVAAILIGCGLLYVAGTTDWESVARSCTEHLQSVGVVDAQGKIKIWINQDPNGDVPDWLVGAAIIDQVRQWLFENGIVKPVTIGYQGTTAVSKHFNATGTTLKSAGFPLFDALRLAYQGDMVAVYGLTSSYMYGFFFSADGRLWLGKYENPYKKANAAYCTLYPTGSLTYVAGRAFSTGAIYGSAEDAYALTNFLTTACYVFDWSKPSTFSFSSGTYATFPVFSKTATNTDFGSSSTTVTFRLCSSNYDGDWGSTTSLYLLTGLTLLDGFGSDLEVGVGQIADPDTDLSTGYSIWYENGAIVQDEETAEQVTVLPIPPGFTLDNASTTTQQDIWNGNSNVSDNETEMTPGTLGATSLGSFLDALVDSLSTAFSTYIVEPILQGLQYLFVPDAAFLDAKIEALRSKYAFADSIINTGTLLGDFFQNIGSQPPIIYIDLGSATGSFKYGGKVAFIDLTWYAEYKPTVDLIIAAFLWLWFVWRVFLSLPGIIAGTSGFWGSGDPVVDSNFRIWPISSQKALGAGDGKIYSGPPPVPPERRLGWRQRDIKERDRRE